MFLFFSLNKAKKFFYVSVIFVLLTVIFAGCSTDSEDDTNHPGTLPSGLIGQWVSDFGDSFEITGAGVTVTLKYDDGGFGFGYSGGIEFISNFDSRSGVIIIKYTDNVNNDKPNPFHAVYYLAFAGKTIEFNNTRNSAEWGDDNTTSLSEAIEKFTRGNMGNYIDLAWSTTYTKQP